MTDLKLTEDGDLDVSSNDLEFTESVRQQIAIRLKWFLGEWRWDPDEGLPYWDEILVKNPNTDLIESAIRSKIFEVTEVTEVDDVYVEIDSATRKATIYYTAITDEETIRGEVSS